MPRTQTSKIAKVGLVLSILASPASAQVLKAVGLNNAFQLGDGTTTNHAVPVVVSGLPGAIAQVDVAYEFSTALLADGTVWGWGDNSAGQLGDGTLDPRQAPVQVIGLSNVTMIACGAQHVLALRSDGTVWSFGGNGWGQLGLGFNGGSHSAAQQVPWLTNIVAVTAGDWFSAALRSDGTVWTWGRNDKGQLGNGTIIQSNTPVQAAGVTGITQFSAGDAFMLARRNDGRVLAWGDNAFGQLGIGNIDQKSLAVVVGGITTASQVAAGASHGLAIIAGGSIFAWGLNNSGQLGDGTLDNRLYPTITRRIAAAVKIAAGGNTSMCVRSTGMAFSWGNNSAGALADSTFINRNEPAPIGNVMDVSLIAVSSGHALILSGEHAAQPQPSTCPADVAPAGGDGMVNVNDLLSVITAWGSCP